MVSPRDLLARATSRSDFFTKSKSMNKKIGSLLLVGVALIGTLACIAGCKSETVVTPLPGGGFQTNIVRSLDTNRLDRASKQAAINGTADVLRSNPQWVSQFQLAQSDLNALSTAPDISLDSILEIVQRLPVKELHSETAQISYQAATVVISIFDVPELPSTATADLQCLAAALSSGVGIGITNSGVPIPNPAN